MKYRTKYRTTITKVIDDTYLLAIMKGRRLLLAIPNLPSRRQALKRLSEIEQAIRQSPLEAPEEGDALPGHSHPGRRDQAGARALPEGEDPESLEVGVSPSH
jgi:hypothetical protein